MTRTLDVLGMLSMQTWFSHHKYYKLERYKIVLIKNTSEMASTSTKLIVRHITYYMLVFNNCFFFHVHSELRVFFLLSYIFHTFRSIINFPMSYRSTRDSASWMKSGIIPKKINIAYTRLYRMRNHFYAFDSTAIEHSSDYITTIRVYEWVLSSCTAFYFVTDNKNNNNKNT